MNGSRGSEPGVVDRALSEAVRLVAARVADELSQPVTSLSLRLELMLAEGADHGGQVAQVDDLHALHRSARRLIHLVEALRCYSGDGLAGSRPVRLNDIVARAQALAGVPGVALALDPGDPLILGDGAVLERFVERVLADACRTSRDERGVRVETTAAAGDPHHAALVIWGVGGVPGLAESCRHLLAEHPGALSVRPIDDRLVLTFPRLMLRLPDVTNGDARPQDIADRHCGDGERAEVDRVVRALTETFDISELAQKITESALPLFRACSAIAWLQQPDGSLACVAAASREPVCLRVGDVLRHVGLAGRAAAECRALWGGDVLDAAGGAGTDELGPDAPGAGQRAVLAVPLIVKGEVIGAIVTEHAEPWGLVHSTIDRVRVFADMIAPAMRNVQLFSRAQVAHAQAEAANRARDEFLALLAHEFRNSLAPIVTAAAVIRQAPPAGAVRNSADIVKRQAEHLARLLDDLRDVSGIARGSIELRRERVSLAAVVEEAVEATRPAADLAGLRVFLSLTPVPLCVEADPTRLKQIIENILGNAVKYTPAGGRIQVTAVAEDGEAVLRVHDTGIGIVPEMLPRVFDLFVRSDGGQAHTRDGMGIGLALVRHLVALHGGRVAAQSEGPGRGAEFTVRLPLGVAT